jgi:ATP-binding protein involved in chromosome partitioning
MNKEQLITLLSSIVHPETGKNLVESDLVSMAELEGGKVVLNLMMAKPRDPFAMKIKNRIEELATEMFGAEAELLTVIVREQAPKQPKPQPRSAAEQIRKVVAVASGKGGVGKSTVTANLAVALRNAGYKVGILDADVYGPSQPKMFGVEEYIPEMKERDGAEYMAAAEVMGIKIMSIGFFIAADDALVWRGPMANNALRQMIHQTEWGELDYLLIDLPPGTGDIHLSVMSELEIDSAVIVTTPQQVALADVLRGIRMFKAEKINIPVAGLIENMAWFTPRELPDNRYYIFGRGGAEGYANKAGVPFLGHIPIIQGIMEGSDEGQPAVAVDSAVEQYYRQVAERMIAGL